MCYKAPTEKKAREVGEELARLLGRGLSTSVNDSSVRSVLSLRWRADGNFADPSVHSSTDPSYKVTTSLPKFWRWVYRWYGVDIVEAMKAKVAVDDKESMDELEDKAMKTNAAAIADASVLQKVPSSNVRDQRNISVEWMAIWEQMEAWSGDHTKKETGQQLLERLQKDYQLTKTNAKPDDSAKRAKNWGGLMPGDRVDVTAKSGLIVRTVIRTVGVKSSDHLPVFVTNEDGEGHDWLDTRLFTITRVE